MLCFGAKRGTSRLQDASQASRQQGFGICCLVVARSLNEGVRRGNLTHGPYRPASGPVEDE